MTAKIPLCYVNPAVSPPYKLKTYPPFDADSHLTMALSPSPEQSEAELAQAVSMLIVPQGVCSAPVHRWVVLL
jgi:hypothetical protein